MKILVSTRDLIKVGFERREDLDFSDDGNHFKGFSYKGLPLSYLKSNGEYYTSLRIDYLEGLNYYDYSNKEWYKLEDEFNGCKEVDVDKLVENAEKIIAGVAELRKELKNKIVDRERLIEQAQAEYDIVNDFLNTKAKISITLTDDYDMYDFKRVADYAKSLRKDIDRELEEVKTCDKTRLRNIEYTLEKYGYIIPTGDNCFYIREIKEFIKKHSTNGKKHTKQS